MRRWVLLTTPTSGALEIFPKNFQRASRLTVSMRRPRPPRCNDADREIHARSAIDPGEQSLDFLDRVHVVFSDSVNDQSALEPGLVGRALRFDGADQNAFAARSRGRRRGRSSDPATAIRTSDPRWRNQWLLAPPAPGFGAGCFSAIFLNCSTLSLTTSAGMANPRPCVGMPCGVKAIFAELIPTKRPERSISGPPLFPGLIAASVWRDRGNRCCSIVMSRFRPLRTPRLIELP